MEKWPNVKVEIGGYTDSYGSDATNLQLSQTRADAVRDFLIDKYDFITADRLTSTGYGEANPIADNSTDEGREKNRRVEAKLLEGGPTNF
jgi:OOP family OmpA-OmpF porin